MGFQIAIDGPAGAGKSTVAKAVAAELGIIYVDTGAMYRAMGLYFHDSGVDTESEEAVNASLDGADVGIRLIDGAQHVFLQGEDVTTRVRSEEAGMLASKTSAYPKNREKMVAMQRKIAETADVVMDGRDIGTVVLPDADLKIYLTASVETRALRRYRELFEKKRPADFRDIERDIEQRDYQDTHRAASPLKKAADAVVVDSSDLTAAQVIRRIVSLARERM